MSDRKGTYYAGINYRTLSYFGQLSFKFLQDVANTHSGFRASEEYRVKVKTFGGNLTPRFEIEYYDKYMILYYYGVNYLKLTRN